MHEGTQAERLLDEQQGTYVSADKGYDSAALVSFITQQESTAVIPSRSNQKSPRDYDRHLYRERNVIERMINKLKQFRRMATRYEKTASNFVALLHLAAITLWLR